MIDDSFRALLLYLSVLQGTFCLEPLFLIVEQPSYLAYAYEILPSSQIGAAFPRHPTEGDYFPEGIGVVNMASGKYPFFSLPVVYASPPDACTPLKNMIYYPTAVLAERGGCTFLTKIINVQQAGGRLALVTDSATATSTWIDMADDETGRSATIPAAYLSGASGNRWSSYLSHSELPPLLITVPLNFTYTSLHRHGRARPPWDLW